MDKKNDKKRNMIEKLFNCIFLFLGVKEDTSNNYCIIATSKIKGFGREDWIHKGDLTKKEADDYCFEFNHSKIRGAFVDNYYLFVKHKNKVSNELLNNYYNSVLLK